MLSLSLSLSLIYKDLHNFFLIYFSKPQLRQSPVMPLQSDLLSQNSLTSERLYILTIYREFEQNTLDTTAYHIYYELFTPGGVR